MPVIKVVDGMGSEIPRRASFELLPAFLPDRSVCPDGEFEGEAVEQYFYNLVSEPFWVDYPKWMLELDRSTWTEHQSRQIYKCKPPTIPADKYIKALEGLRFPALDGEYFDGHNDAIDEAIKTIRELL